MAQTYLVEIVGTDAAGNPIRITGQLTQYDPISAMLQITPDEVPAAGGVVRVTATISGGKPPYALNLIVPVGTVQRVSDTEWEWTVPPR